MLPRRKLRTRKPREMKATDSLVVSRLDEYIRLVEELAQKWGTMQATTHGWYRGQANVDWPLTPSLHRNATLCKYEPEIVRDFKAKSRQLLTEQPQCEIEWYFMMQHHGMPTRLLDWTESPLVALYFAVSSDDPEHNSAVWILDPWSLNRLTIGRCTVPVAADEALTDYTLDCNVRQTHTSETPRPPVAVRPIYNSARVSVQKGTFTIHGEDRDFFSRLPTPLAGGGGTEKVLLSRIIIDRTPKESCSSNCTWRASRTSRCFQIYLACARKSPIATPTDTCTHPRTLHLHLMKDPTDPILRTISKASATGSRRNHLPVQQRPVSETDELLPKYNVIIGWTP